MPDTPHTEARGFQGYHTSLEGQSDDELTLVDRGTPCGEYLRRYWQPVALSSELTDLPLAVEMLGEPLVLFRDGDGRVGLLHRHCAHRGASLEYGIVSDRGIICCYHGWHYDIDGTLIRAGSEPASSPVCQNVVQGAYPAQERNGIVFAYLGPPDERPDLPCFDTEQQADTEAVPFSITTPCNWLQVYENTQDPIHVLHLHARSSGIQFGAASGVDQVIDYVDTPHGMMNIQTRQIEDRVWVRTTESLFPNGNQTGAIWEEAEQTKVFQRTAALRWMVPVNNVTTRTIGWRFFSPQLDPRGQGDAARVGKESIDFIGQTGIERNYEQSQRQPGDYEAQVSQRPVAWHSREHHGASDAGVFRVRRLLRKRIRALADGEPVYRPALCDRIASTYTQDTVVPVETVGASPPPTREALKDFGRRVASAVLDTAGLEPAERQAAIRRRLESAGE